MDIRRFLAELKGRGVYRVAALYAAGSWALLQVGDIFFPILGFPEWAITGVLAVAALGFPVAIILAWVFEVTAEGIVEIDPEVNFGKLRLSPARLAELGLLLALIFMVGFLYLERLTLQEQFAEAVADGGSRRPSVAVMAFQNMSDDPSVDYFGDGLAEEILNLLARVNELDVAARTSSFYYKNKDIELKDVSERLGVAHILEGSVRRSGDKVRVTAQLIEMESGFNLWSQTYDRDYSDSFRIQDDIARQVVASMHIALSDASSQLLNERPVMNPEAYDYYLQGRDYLRQSLSKESLDNAIELFAHAIELDPEYAAAHAGLCDSHLGLYRVTLAPEQFLEAKASCEAALAIEGDALPVFVALGNLYRYSGKYEQALEQFNKALAIDPNSIDALDGLGHTYRQDNKASQAEDTFQLAIQKQPLDWRGYMGMGGLLFTRGRFEEAIPYYGRITNLMPDNAQAFNDLGACYFLVGDFESAADALRRSLELEPTALAYSNAGSSLFFLGEFDEALEMYMKAVELAPDDFQNWGALGDTYRHLGGDMRELAEPMYRNAIKLAMERLAVNPSDTQTLGLLAHYQAGVGDREQALQNIARAQALAPEDVYVNYNAATAFCSLGDEDQAELALSRAVEMGYSVDLVAVDANLCVARDTTSR